MRTEVMKIYICSSVHRNSRLKKSNKMQLYAHFYLLLNYSTCFGRLSRPSSGVHNTAASGTNRTVLSGERASSNVTKFGQVWSYCLGSELVQTRPNLVTFDHTIWEVSFFKLDQIWSRLIILTGKRASSNVTKFGHVWSHYLGSELLQTWPNLVTFEEDH